MGADSAPGGQKRNLISILAPIPTNQAYSRLLMSNGCFIATNEEKHCC
jgi:hypothetical protein